MARSSTGAKTSEKKVAEGNVCQSVVSEVAEDFFSHDQRASSAWTLQRVWGHGTMFVAELSLGSAPVPIWAGVDTDRIQH